MSVNSPTVGEILRQQARCRARELASELSAYKIPKRFAAVPAADVPLLPSGKVDLRQLKQVSDAG